MESGLQLVAESVEDGFVAVRGVADESGSGGIGVLAAEGGDNRQFASAGEEVFARIRHVGSANVEVAEIGFAGAAVDEHENQRNRRAQAIS